MNAHSPKWIIRVRGDFVDAREMIGVRDRRDCYGDPRGSRIFLRNGGFVNVDGDAWEWGEAWEKAYTCEDD